MNPTTIERWRKGFKKFAKNDLLSFSDILAAINEAKEEYDKNDIMDGLNSLGIGNEPITFDQFVDLIETMKNPDVVVDAFSVFDREKTGFIEENKLRDVLRQFAPNLKAKEIEDLLEKTGTSINGKIKYREFVKYLHDM